MELLTRAWLRVKRWFRPEPVVRTVHDPAPRRGTIERTLDSLAAENERLSNRGRDDEAAERIGELIEARAMAGSGPWRVPAHVIAQTDAIIEEAVSALRDRHVGAREAAPAIAQGAYGDIELALQNVEWRRQINLSWLEFSRWGIQQIILICRLHYIKSPVFRRGVDVSAQYVFGRGVEISSPDPDANDVLKSFIADNQTVLGQVGLTDLERRKYYDGNLYFACFADAADTGRCRVRTIDATEIEEIVTNPDDTDEPWFYKRNWTSALFDVDSGATRTEGMKRWYPALEYDPPSKPATIGGVEVDWKTRIHHRKCGAISKWHFGCPLGYAALDWVRAAKRFLEACATQKQALAQFSMIMTTKGGQAAIAGAKAQLSTTVSTNSTLWDENPTAVNASIPVMGSGTELEPFKITGEGGNPEEVRRFELMAFRVFGCPETFWSDVKTGNLATAQSLDRPTELNYREKQEAWREDLAVLGMWALRTSAAAPSGRLREALMRRATGRRGKVIMPDIREAKRATRNNGDVKYTPVDSPDTIEVMVTFPSIREGDIPALTAAVVQGATLGNKAGDVIGTDERATVRKLYEVLGYEDGDDLVNEQYPLEGKDKYDPLRKEEPENKPTLNPATGLPAAPTVPEPEPAVEALVDAVKRYRKAVR